MNDVKVREKDLTLKPQCPSLTTWFNQYWYNTNITFRLVFFAFLLGRNSKEKLFFWAKYFQFLGLLMWMWTRANQGKTRATQIVNEIKKAPPLKFRMGILKT